MSEWQPPEKLANAIKSEFPSTEMPSSESSPEASSGASQLPQDSNWVGGAGSSSTQQNPHLPAAMGATIYPPPYGLPSPRAAAPPPAPGNVLAKVAEGQQQAAIKRTVAGLLGRTRLCLTGPRMTFASSL